MKLLEPGSLQRMIIMAVIVVGIQLCFIAWLLHIGGLPPTWAQPFEMVMLNFAFVMLSIGFILRIKELEKQILELKSQLAAKQ